MSKGIVKPGYTQIPNELLDNLDQFSNAELRVLLVAFRDTLGWHRNTPQPMSHTYLETRTGMSSFGVRTGLQEAKQRGWLEEASEIGNRRVKLYSICFADPVSEIPSQPHPVSEIHSDYHDPVSEIHSRAVHPVSEIQGAPHDLNPPKERTTKENYLGGVGGNHGENIMVPKTVIMDEPLENMKVMVKRELHQYGQQCTNVAKVLLQRYTGKQAEQNIEGAPVTPDELVAFGQWWDTTKRGKDGQALTRPKNMGSIKTWIETWRSETAKVMVKQSNEDKLAQSIQQSARETAAMYAEIWEMANDQTKPAA